MRIALVLFGIGFGWISGFITERDMLVRSKQITANIVSENVKKHFNYSDLLIPKTGPDYKNFSKKMMLELTVSDDGFGISEDF